MIRYNLQDALAQAVQGQACLFLGAGFSTLFTDLESQPLPTGGQLANEMTAAANGKTTTDLRVAATQLLRAVGDDEYQRFLQQRFTVKDVGQPAIEIASEKWARVYTTNFDDGFEKAASRAGRKVMAATAADLLDQYLHAQRVCVHVHGFVDRVSPSTIEQDLILTLPGYAGNKFLESPWHSLLKHDLRASRFVFFVGYSLRDLDIARTLQQCGLDIASKVFFIVGVGGDTDLEVLLDEYGTVCPIGIDGFAAALKAVDRTKLPPIYESFQAFSELQSPPNPTRPSDSDMYRLLMSGFVREDLLLSPGDKQDPISYSVSRDIIAKEVAADLSVERPNYLAIQGEISNGKSIALYQAAQALLGAGFRVFILEDSSKNWSEEIRKIFTSQGQKVAVIIDDCSIRLPCVEDTFRFARKGDAVLIADRSSRLDAIEERIKRYAGQNPVLQFDIDELSESERQAFISLLQIHGLWGDLANRTLRRKDTIIQHDLGNQIRGILLGVLESPHAISRLQQSLEDIDFANKQYDGLVMSLILTVTQAAELRQDIVDDLVDSIPLRRLLASSQGARALIQIKSPNMVRTVSAIVAETIVRRFVPLDTLVRCIRTAVRRSIQFGVSELDKQFPRRIMQFRLIQQLLPDTQTRSLESIEAIYDSIKTEHGFGNDPQFWLQYAICELFLRNFERAETYFRTAYSVCRPGYDRKFIDNHYARYLLESAVEGPGAPLPIAVAEEQANKAKSLLLPQLAEDAHYPYKVAANFLPFVKMYHDEITTPTKEGLLRFFATVIEHARRATDRGNDHHYVTQCKSALESARRTLLAT